MYGNAMIFAIASAIVIVGILLATRRIRLLGTLALKGAVGGAAIWGINAVVYFIGLSVAVPGLNLLTVGIAALLGLPGLIMMYGAALFL
ncbi:MAG: pro-sigmaK processing inhibitor BofA family protein [Defluviitaleaceae bacterium]|nr:pro-sigmaK processing inhibitor BofA family protein [Defluviitaleaceae bacterium]